MDCGPDGWAVWHGDGSTDYYQPPCHAKWFGSIQEADVWVMEVEARISYLEYGVQHITKEEQETGLRAEIEDLTERLIRLRHYGRQWREEADIPLPLSSTDDMRDALKDISTKAHCIALYGPAAIKTWPEVWAKFMEISAIAARALAKARRSAETL